MEEIKYHKIDFKPVTIPFEPAIVDLIEKDTDWKEDKNGRNYKLGKIKIYKDDRPFCCGFVGHEGDHQAHVILSFNEELVSKDGVVEIVNGKPVMQYEK